MYAQCDWIKPLDTAFMKCYFLNVPALLCIRIKSTKVAIIQKRKQSMCGV